MILVEDDGGGVAGELGGARRLVGIMNMSMVLGMGTEDREEGVLRWESGVVLF